jgi:beta-N-acetylhexosaminidase
MVKFPVMAELETKIAQMLMVGIAGDQITAFEREIFEHYQFGGFILFGRNCSEPAQIQLLCRSIREVAEGPIPFIAIDQEGGRVHRLPLPFTHFPAAAVIGATGSPELAYRAGRATAAELALLGINLDFAPVLDVHSNPKNPIIGDRSFGSTPEQVIGMAWAWNKGLQSGGIIPCGKHFPGHGDTDKDSHLDLPAVGKSLEELRAVELSPFVHACRNQIEALMTAHVLFPALDRQLPATLSKEIITGILRGELGYDGVVFSDDLEMKAISANFSTEQTALLSVRAGIDMLLYCHDLSKAIAAFAILCREAQGDSQLRTSIDTSYARIIAVKHRYSLTGQGMEGGKIVGQLARFNHGRLIDEIYGSL